MYNEYLEYLDGYQNRVCFDVDIVKSAMTVYNRGEYTLKAETERPVPSTKKTTCRCTDESIRGDWPHRGKRPRRRSVF